MSKQLKLLSTKQTQQHPFHVLHSSKLPVFMFLFAGSTVLLLIAKLHAISYADSFGYSVIVSQLLISFFKYNFILGIARISLIGVVLLSVPALKLVLIV